MFISQTTDSHFANYRFSFRKLQIPISQTTDSHFANYRFSFRKLQISISQTTDFHFVSSQFVSQTTVSPLWSGYLKKLILENPQSLCIWRILEKFENSQKIPFLFMKLVKISDDFKQTVYTGAKKLLRIIIIIITAFLLLFLFLFLYIKHFLSYLQPFVFLVTF